MVEILQYYFRLTEKSKFKNINTYTEALNKNVKYLLTWTKDNWPRFPHTVERDLQHRGSWIQNRSRRTRQRRMSAWPFNTNRV